MDSVGERIKTTRLSQGLSQVELAHAVEVSQPTVANWENDSHIPRQAVLERLSELLNISLHWLLSGGLDQNGFTQISQQYLNTPIRHVPIIAWPNCQDLKDNDIEAGPAQAYLTISTLAKKPFALIINDPNLVSKFPLGTVIVFDTEMLNLDEDGYYLFVDNQIINLRQWQKQAQSAQIQSMPLAKALMAIRPL